MFQGFKVVIKLVNERHAGRDIELNYVLVGNIVQVFDKRLKLLPCAATMALLPDLQRGYFVCANKEGTWRPCP